MGSEYLEAVRQALDAALRMADDAGDSLVGALIAEAKDAIDNRLRELGHQSSV